MDSEKKKKLQDAGWQVGDADDLLTRDFRETVKERAARDPEYLSELLKELHEVLVREAYMEGFREGLRLEHPAASADYSWNRSKSKEKLDDD